MGSVLVLNATYEPLNVVSTRRAIVLLLKDKAEVLEATRDYIHAAGFALPIPAVIRLVYYVRVPRPLHIPLSRQAIMLRDAYTCQYCGAQPPRSSLTLDHIQPKVRGGQNTWENLVCACKRCNQRKGCRTPQEAGMKLRKDPVEPRFLTMVVIDRAARHESWNKYVDRDAVSL